jgi:hypothetical protein
MPSFGLEQERAALSQYYSLEQPELHVDFYRALEPALMQALTDLPDWRAPDWFMQPFPLLFPHDVFLHIVRDIDPTTHPGYPACLLFGQKGDFVDEERLLYTAVCVRWFLLHVLADEILDDQFTPEQLVLNGVADPFLCAIKNEAVKIGKDDRIIHMSVIVREILEAALFLPFKHLCSENWGKTFYAPGFSFTPPATNRLFPPSQIAHLDLLKNDSPKYDTSLLMAEQMTFGEYASLKVVGSLPWVRRMQRALLYTEFRKLNLTSDGRCHLNNGGEGGASGVFITTLRNTVCRRFRTLAVHHCLGNLAPFSRHASDDTVEENVPGLEDEYARLGIRLRDSDAVTSDGIEFCSHFWSPGCIPVGTRIAKSFYKLARTSHGFDQSRFSALCNVYANHPDLPSFASRFIRVKEAASRTGQNIIN